MTIEELNLNVAKLNEEKEKFISQNCTLGADKAVITFISNILFHGVYGVSVTDSVESIRNLFEAGYCYYFAKILEEAFPNGMVCLCYPYGHIIYAYKGYAYDITGVSDAEYDMYIPVAEIGQSIEDFMRRGVSFNCTEAQLDEIGKNAKMNHSYIKVLSYYEAKECQLRDVIKERSKAVITKGSIDFKYEQDRTNFIIEHDRLRSMFKKGLITRNQYNDFMKQYCDEAGVSWEYVKIYDEIAIEELRAF